MAPMEYTMMPTLPQRECVALLVLRLGLGIFLLLWSIDKLVAPEGTVRIFALFYYLSISSALVYGIGVVEAILRVLILMGAWKRYTYAIGLGLHTLSTLATWKQLLNPFGPNHLFIASIPVFTAFVLLYLLRDHDTLCAVDR